MVILGGFAAWGMFRPVAPKGWDKPAENVIIASKSTTRYVVLETDGEKRLHPVLNMSSAKLLLDPDKGKIIKVAESVLDKGDIPRGATLGIPYAPDRLPSAEEAGGTKRWAVCERPGDGGRTIQKAAFLFAERERTKTDGTDRLHGGELLYVEGPDRTRYIVDAGGTAYPLADEEQLLRQVAGQDRTPQRVSQSWLATLHRGDRVDFPEIPGTPGTDAAIPAGDLDPGLNKVGMVLEASDGAREQKYVVLPGRVAPVSDFTARLLLNSEALVDLGQAGKARRLSGGAFTPGKAFNQDKKWPQSLPEAVNSASTAKNSRNTVCNVLRSVDHDTGATTLSTWAGTTYPEQLPAGSSSAYVTPGSGQLYRQFQGTRTDTGFLFLVTDTGLRYAMQSNSDSGTDASGIGSSGTEQDRRADEQEVQKAQNRLGYKSVEPRPVPAAWSAFLPTGPRLSTGSANQPQGS
ncbi:type VII secretion protein EccB [Streptomyces yaizuensis]|uniref:Type VII secretion protein EccB n=1 Tax=Streptomyces yaizuensis TaxID=2989713 RepID=A0ABQ5P8Z5_9ACTN|nr:type VII secretion protein EccB [Streptomyces sp. YSPA8]